MTKVCALPKGLMDLLAAMPKLAVAFSGGLDSRFLCHAALASGRDLLALHVRGPHVPERESREALAWAKKRGIRLLVADFNPLGVEEVAVSDRLRCYACKRALMHLLKERLVQAGESERLLCDGTNADDRTAYRPGLKALAEAGVRSPLAEVGLSKKTIRLLAERTGLDRSWQRARPCLLTRFAYGLAPSLDLLQRLDAAEAELESLSAREGRASLLGDFRLRLCPQPLFQAEYLPPEIQRQVLSILERHGFAAAELVQTDTVSGFHDRRGR